MKQLKVLLAGVLLVMWLPATSFCLAENAGLITTSGCCDESSATDTPTCCALASATYKVDDNNLSILPGLECSLVFVAPGFNPPQDASSEGCSCESPPEVRSSWQFYIRAAAPPRAPSFAS